MSWDKHDSGRRPQALLIMPASVVLPDLDGPEIEMYIVFVFVLIGSPFSFSVFLSVGYHGRLIFLINLGD